MACFTQKSAQVLQKVQEPRKNFRVTSRPSSVSTEVVEMAPPAACGDEPAPEGPKPRDDGLPVNDPAKCVYCTLCAKKCPAGALTVDRAAKTWTLDEDKCIACGTCHDVCPKKCIIM